MYFWKTKALAEELSKQTLSQKNRFLHLLFFIAIQAVMMELSLYSGLLLTPLNLTVSVVFVTVAIVGTWFCYHVNQSGDGKDFIARYVCMWLPLFVRIALLAMAATMVVVPIGAMVIGPDYLDSNTWLDAVLLLGFELIFYWRLTIAIGSISRGRESSVSVTADGS